MFLFSFVVLVYMLCECSLVWIHVYLCAFHCEAQRSTSSVFLCCIHFIFLRQGLFLNLELSNKAKQAIQKSPEIMGLQWHCVVPGPFCGVRHACKEGTEPPFQLSLFFEQTPEMRVLWGTHFIFNFSFSRLSP